MPTDYQGRCHCGNVTFTFSGEKITSGLRCNCSICSRKGAMMSPEAIPEASLAIVGKENLSLYQFGAKTAKHYFCKTCGIYTFHETARQPGHLRANLGCFDTLDSSEFEVAIFDGKSLL